METVRTLPIVGDENPGAMTLRGSASKDGISSPGGELLNGSGSRCSFRLEIRITTAFQRFGKIQETDMANPR